MLSPQLILVLFSAFPIVVVGQACAARAYTPKIEQCPPGFSLVRQAGAPYDPSVQNLSPLEAEYLQARKSDVLPDAWKSYLKNVQDAAGTKFSLPSYVSSILCGNGSASPTLAIAASGGGYRAAIFGAGVLNALDGRNSTSVAVGTAGLLQSATYLAGLSGGSWLVTSLVQANFPSINDLVFGSAISGEYSGWLAQFGLIAPTNNTALNQGFVAGLLAEVKGKHDIGFPVTVGDLWARALSRHFINGTIATNFFDNSSVHGAGITFSGLANVSAFTDHSLPFPLVVVNSVSSSGNVSNTIDGAFVPLSNPIYEFNVFEMGSYDPILSAFTPIKYLGTTNVSSCVTGYDQAAFVAAMSSNLFNEFNTSTTALANSIIGPIVQFMNQSLPQPGIELDVVHLPNPFFGLASSTFIDSAEEDLILVDGGEDGEVIPLQPLMVKAREVDIIVVIDASGNTTGWADGSSLIATQNRTLLFPSAYNFPPVPTTSAVFVSSSLTTQPTFFGCNTPISAPLLVYLANGGPPRNSQSHPLTNTSTDQLVYMPDEIQGMLDQTWAIATQGISNSSSGEADPMWPVCLACAIVDRARNRTGLTREGACIICFERYCWSDEQTSGTMVLDIIGAMSMVFGGAIVSLTIAFFF